MASVMQPQCLFMGAIMAFRKLHLSGCLGARLFQSSWYYLVATALNTVINLRINNWY